MLVLADGCFDPLHYGHVRYLEAASKLGDTLLVRIAPDMAIIDKGREPFQDQEERAKTVLALGVVDRVCSHQTLAEAIRDCRPSYLVKGPDWKGKLPEEVSRACQESGTRVIFLRTQERTCTERLSA